MQALLTAQRVIQRAREGGGPTFIECKTMRMHGHSEHDSAKYVPRALLEEWVKKDPILKAQHTLKALGYVDETDLLKIQKSVEEEIQAAVEFAEQSPLPEGPETLEGVFAPNHVEARS